MDWWTSRPDHEHRRIRHGHPSVSEIIPELLVGEYPRSEDISWLKLKHRVTAVHNLQDDDDLRINGLDIHELSARYEIEGIKFLRTPVSDGSADAMREHLEVALAGLHSLVSQDERVYLHCNAGLNRAPTLAIAYLRAFRQMSLDEAMAHVKERRVCGPFMTVLEEYFGPRHIKPEA